MGIIDLTSELCKECLWYCFAGVLQQDLNILKEHWNTHHIRKSRHNTVAGRPDSLFYLPECHGGTPNLLLEVSQQEIDYVSDHIVQVSYANEYQEYFDYAIRMLKLFGCFPNNWKEAYALYCKLMDIAENGNGGT